MSSNNYFSKIKKISQKNLTLGLLLAFSISFFGFSLFFYHSQDNSTNRKQVSASEIISDTQKVALKTSEQVKFTLKYGADLDLGQNGSDALIQIEIGDQLVIDKITDTYDSNEDGELDEPALEICPDLFNLDKVNRKSIYYVPVSANLEDSCSGLVTSNSDDLGFSPLKRAVYGKIEIFANLNPKIFLEKNLHTNENYEIGDLLSPEMNLQGVKSIFKVRKINDTQLFTSQDSFAVQLAE